MIRKADIKDIDQIMEMYSSCVKGMIEAGIDQWDDTYPNSEVIYKDIKNSTYYVKTMNNKIVVDIFQTFVDNDFSVCRVNFRGVGKSDGEFDNGQGELADAAAALDWLERENFDNSQCWVS